MRRLLLALSVAALALVAAGCYPSAGAAWTYAPATPSPTVNPSASVEPSASAATPSGAASADASQPASAGPSEPASAPPSEAASAAATVVQVSALGITFEQQALTAPAGTAFTVHFDNKDGSTQHNVEIRDAQSMTMFKGDLVTGPIAVDYAVPALAAGAYTFNCSIHPNMTGTLTVGP